MVSADPLAFVMVNTVVETPPLTPEIKLYLANEVIPLWKATEAELEEMGLPPPYWAFAWAGGQALARYLLDNPGLVAHKRVLDFAAGSGLQGIAAAKAGAAKVEAAEIDAFARAAISLNAELNEVDIDPMETDQIGRMDGGWDLVLAGDVCYERPMAEQVFTWLQALAGHGVEVLMGDPGRTYLPKTGLEKVARYAVQTSRELEDTDVRNAIVWRVTAPDRT